MHALVLAAGYGTRMSLDTEVPKHLLEIGKGIPVIELIVKNILSSRFIEDCFIIVNNKFYSQFDKWKRSKSDGLRDKVYLVNNGTNSNNERLGSVGDLIYGLEYIKKNINYGLLVAQGDDLLYGFSVNDFINEYKRKGSTLILTHKLPVEDLAARFGVVEVDENNKVIRVKEKPKLEDIESKDGAGLANGGTYIFTISDLSTVFRYKREMNKIPLDGTGNLISWMVSQPFSSIFSYEHPKENWWDIGKPEDLRDAREFYQNL